MTVTGPLASTMANKVGHRAVVMAGGLISSGAMVIAVFSTLIEPLLIVFGIGAGTFCRQRISHLVISDNLMRKVGFD